MYLYISYDRRNTSILWCVYVHVRKDPFIHSSSLLRTSRKKYTVDQESIEHRKDTGWSTCCRTVVLVYYCTVLYCTVLLCVLWCDDVMMISMLCRCTSSRIDPCWHASIDIGILPPWSSTCMPIIPGSTHTQHQHTKWCIQIHSATQWTGTQHQIPTPVFKMVVSWRSWYCI